MAHTEHTSMKPSRGQSVQTPKYQEHDPSFGSNIFNTSTLVNAGLNLATAGGLVIWVNSKFSSYEEKIDKLVQIIAEQKERIDTHEKFIVKHEQIFRGELPSDISEISNNIESPNTQSQSSRHFQEIQRNAPSSPGKKSPVHKLPKRKGKKSSKKIGSKTTTTPTTTSTTTSTTIPSSKTLEVDTVQEEEEDEIDKAIEHFAADEIESVVSSSKISSETSNCEGDVCVIGDDSLKKS